MSNVVAAESKTTSELCESVGKLTRAIFNRNVFARLRRQYKGRVPEPRMVGNAALWPPETEGAIVTILSEEERLREMRA